jgi:hypothetical protein
VAVGVVGGVGVSRLKRRPQRFAPSSPTLAQFTPPNWTLWGLLERSLTGRFEFGSRPHASTH